MAKKVGYSLYQVILPNRRRVHWVAAVTESQGFGVTELWMADATLCGQPRPRVFSTPWHPHQYCGACRRAFEGAFDRAPDDLKARVEAQKAIS